MSFHRLGFGTYQMTDRSECIDAVTTALDTGYRHLDTAQGYDNETYVGEALADSDVDRADVFVATKLDPGNLAYDDVVETTRESAERLGVDRIDLQYVHWPLDTYDSEATLDGLAAIVEEGLVDHVGLSNFTPELLEEAIEGLDDRGVDLFAHQVECHPLHPQEELRSYAREDDHWLVAYSPIARGEVFDVPEIVDIAEKHNATPAQVSLAWLLDKESVAAIPKSATPAHIRENYGALDISLDPEDVRTIDGIDREYRVVDGDWTPW
ncbi:aldo/keto reductase [Natranaeroarchaeum sulfidigenes]|uniref:Aldo/keto reductase, related to diketogulonate reductase n=1 Tax=Natranaeroarchaeum sulfidigenes TaxID=2784880 RepID=A0A897MVD8_9EURY|nr:aldo/keto reductase [Natranaeroarchaeum sulfidigenes]QSG03033.1 Aldo/keto reductase, related to diketogulonate reductase [Natranaeroarchaeum sulfidigenes]